MEFNWMTVISQDFINDIQNRILKSDSEFALGSLIGATETLKSAFPGPGHFFMEFIQNSDDAKSETVEFEINTNNVKIFNNGKCFDSKDVKSICKIGRSSKTPTENMGYLGVGFKSIFLISNCSHIYSGDYQFKFDATFWNNEKLPWQLIPIWIDEPIKSKNEMWNTEFILNFDGKNDKMMYRFLQDEVTSEHLHNRIILFIKNIKKITIRDTVENFKRDIVKSANLSKHDNYELYCLSEYENDELINDELWLIFRKNVEILKKIREDPTLPENRKNINEREVLVAFKLDSEYNLRRDEKGTAHTGVFSFLPLIETESGLNFLIQSDFITTAARTDILRGSLWNKWLADEIYNLIIEKSIEVFKNDVNWRMNFTDILYSSERGHELFAERILKPLNKYLKENDVLLADDETFVNANEILFVNDEMGGFLSKKDLIQLYPDKQIIHKDCTPHPHLQIQECPENIDDFINSNLIESEVLIQSKAKNKDIEWFKKIYTMYTKTYNHRYFYNKHSRYNVAFDEFWEKMRNLHKPIILTENYNIVAIKDCYINPNNIEIPDQLKDEFKIVHPQITADENFEKFWKKLNEERYYRPTPSTKVIKKLNENDIKTAIKTQETLKMDEKIWLVLSNDKKVKNIKQVKYLWETYSLPLSNYNYLTLKTKNEKWQKPKKLIFPKEYNPNHNIETLITKKLYDYPLEFIDPIFINETENENEIRKWRVFLEELGVDTIIAKTKREGGTQEDIVQRIGVLTAKKFENDQNKRNPRILDESEKPGYDIESSSENEVRFIEVKATSKASYDIFLTVNEFKSLREKHNNYFVYVVTNVLNEPLLHVSQGDKLLEIPNTKMVIPFKEWINNAKEEEYQP